MLRVAFDVPRVARLCLPVRHSGRQDDEALLCVRATCPSIRLYSPLVALEPSRHRPLNRLDHQRPSHHRRHRPRLQIPTREALSAFLYDARPRRTRSVPVRALLRFESRGSIFDWLDRAEKKKKSDESTRTDSGHREPHTFSRLAFLDASLAACLGAFLFLLCFWYLLVTWTHESDPRTRDVIFSRTHRRVRIVFVDQVVFGWYEL